MEKRNEKIPDPKEIEKEISEFLAKRFNNTVKIVSPVVVPQELSLEKRNKPDKKKKKIIFNLLPEELIDYLDQYIVKQDNAKAILATKICTHFNRIKQAEENPNRINSMVGSIKNNVLMLGPTGVGKTYIIKLIADKIGVPFVKGDGTKFSETGYVGGDVEDLVRDLVREADDDIELAQCGIIYIDEIDKIAGSRNFIGADVSRSGVQRALLKPMEETEVDLKVPNDPISMIQEIERFRKTGKRKSRMVNTKNILFIMSGAFADLTEIIKKRIMDQGIGFGSQLKNKNDIAGLLEKVSSEDLIKFGFESEFVGRLPVRAVFENLNEDDLLEILKNPNNPIILGKKLDFAAYGIDIKFEESALRILSKNASLENTGARGIVSSVEKALLSFEKKLPSSNVKKFPVTKSVITDPEKSLDAIIAAPEDSKIISSYQKLTESEIGYIKTYLKDSSSNLGNKYNLTMTPARINILASYYSRHIIDIENAIKKIKEHYDEVKKIELYFFKNHDINIVLEEEAVDYIIDKFINTDIVLDDFYKQLSQDFKHALNLVREKTGKNRFFITKDALIDPESFVRDLIRKQTEFEIDK